MAISITQQGTVTVSAATGGAIASTDVTASGIASTDRVLLTASGAATQTLRNVMGVFNFQVVKGTDKFTVYANAPDLPADVTLDYIIVRETV